MMTDLANIVTIHQAKSRFLESISRRHSERTTRAYSNALETFLNMLASQQIDVTTFLASELGDSNISDYVNFTKNLSPATEGLYLQVIKNFFEFLQANNVSSVDLSRVKILLRQRSHRPKTQYLDYPEEEIKCLINAMQNVTNNLKPGFERSDTALLRDARDSALILTLADTGLRVEEVCQLKVGNIDWVNKRGILIGRGNKQNLIRFSSRAIKALRVYLDIRKPVDISSDQDISILPLFARHDKGAGTQIKPVTSTTIRNIISDRVNEVFGSQAVGIITPHTFLHYFVTTILRSTGNLKLAQVLARHANIQITQKYAHISNNELDKGYYEIFEKKNSQRE